MDYVSDIIDLVIQIDNPTLLHVKTLAAMVVTFGPIVSTKTNVVIFFW